MHTDKKQDEAKVPETDTAGKDKSTNDDKFSKGSSSIDKEEGGIPSITESDIKAEEDHIPISLQDLGDCNLSMEDDRSQEGSRIMKFMENIKDNVVFRNPLGKV